MTSVGGQQLRSLEEACVERPFLQEVALDSGLLNLDQGRHDGVPELGLILRHRDANRVGQGYGRRLLELVRVSLDGLVDGIDVIDISVDVLMPEIFLGLPLATNTPSKTLE